MLQCELCEKGTRFLGSKNCERQLLALSCFSVCLSVCRSDTMEKKRRLHWTDFYENWLQIFRKSVEKIQVLLKCYKNNKHFT
jgi:hypothetical protein